MMSVFVERSLRDNNTALRVREEHRLDAGGWAAGCSLGEPSLAALTGRRAPPGLPLGNIPRPAASDELSDLRYNTHS